MRQKRGRGPIGGAGPGSRGARAVPGDTAQLVTASACLGTRSRAPGSPSQGGPLPKLWAHDGHHPLDGAAVLPKPQQPDATPPEWSPHVVPSACPARLPSTSVPAHGALHRALGTDTSSPLMSPRKRPLLPPPTPRPHLSIVSTARTSIPRTHS